MADTINKKHQIISIFSSLANVNMSGQFQTAEDAQNYAYNHLKAILKDSTITNYIGEGWQLVWGPKTSNSKQTCKKPLLKHYYVSDNTMYVVKNDNFQGTNQPLYVVGIAGTNPISHEGWFKEDFKVFAKEPWGNSEAGNISKGATLGLNILLDLVDPITSKNLLDFLENDIKDTACEIATCGHSLGGALSPLVALKIAEKFANPDIKVSTYPSAGDTSGDDKFVAYFERTIGKDNYHSIINKNDIVPHAWEIDMLKQIKEIYTNSSYRDKTQVPTPKDITGIIGIDIGRLEIGKENYTRICKEQEYVFEGVIAKQDEAVRDKIETCMSNSKHLAAFGTLAGYQHTTAYGLQGFQLDPEVNKVVTEFLTKAKTDHTVCKK